jgi:polar amino acid transport system substrate-binding protein
MMLKKAFLAALLSLAGVLAHASDAADPPRLHLMTENSPPISMRDGNKVVGSATDKVREVMARAGIAYTLELLPWRRAFTLVQQRPNACLFSTTRTPEREHLFKWVGPTDEGEWVLLGRADRQFKLTTLEDARPLRIGTYHGDVRDEYLRARGFNVDSAPNDAINPHKLLMDRVDLWAAGVKRGTAMLKRIGWEGKIVPVLSFNRVHLYLACNPEVPTELIDKMNAVLAAMGRDGTMRRIEKQYESWTVPSTPEQ